MRDLQQDYPLVNFGHNPDQSGEYREIEDCPICKESMITARKLPCGHCFHWFKKILIESGSKNCPICRAEFSNRNRLQPPNQAQNANNAAAAAVGVNNLAPPNPPEAAGANQDNQNNQNAAAQQQQQPNQENNGAAAAPQRRSIFNFRLGGWLPNFSVRLIRQRQAPVISLNEAIDRIREIFPQLTQQQIAQEIRNAGGHIDQAILNISENVQRGQYDGVLNQ